MSLCDLNVRALPWISLFNYVFANSLEYGITRLGSEISIDCVDERVLLQLVILVQLRGLWGCD